MKITNADVLNRLLDDDFDEWMEENEHQRKNRRNKSMRAPQRGDSKKLGRRRIQEARSQKQRESYELTE